MRPRSSFIAPVIFAGFVALALTGCGPSEVQQSENKPAVHGELIRNEPITPRPTATAAVSQTPAASPQVAAAPSIVSKSEAVPVVVPVPVVSAPPVAEVAKPVVVPAPVPTVSGYSVIGFDRLASYNFQVDDAPLTNTTAAADKANEQIPTQVKSLNDQKVSIKGFMLPLKVADGTVTEFLIMKDQSMCCYGSVPKITEWVSVKTPGKGVKPIMDQPISILGTLHVGAMRENGYLVGIYQMDGDKLDTSSN